MGKILKASFEKNCIGCELCVAQVQRQLGKVGIEGSPIRVFRNTSASGKLIFKVDIDASVHKLDIEEIEKICPTLVFTIEEESEEDHELAK